MAKSRQGLRARVSQATGRRRKKPTNPVQRASDGVKRLVSGTDRLFRRSARRKAATKQASAKKTGATRKRSGRQRQAATKKGARTRIRGGRQRQASTKKAARTRGAKTS